MSRKKKSTTSPPVGAGPDPGWDDYSLSGAGPNVLYLATLNDASNVAFMQGWYQSDTVAPRCLVTVVGPSLDDGAPSPDARSGPNSLAWAVALNQRGDVIAVGAKIDVTD